MPNTREKSRLEQLGDAAKSYFRHVDEVVISQVRDPQNAKSYFVEEGYLVKVAVSADVDNMVNGRVEYTLRITEGDNQ